MLSIPHAADNQWSLFLNLTSIFFLYGQLTHLQSVQAHFPVTKKINWFISLVCLCGVRIYTIYKLPATGAMLNKAKYLSKHITGTVLSAQL